jgi:hypothetical protein
MTDTIRTRAELENLLADNNSGDIDAQDARDLLKSIPLTAELTDTIKFILLKLSVADDLTNHAVAPFTGSIISAVAVSNTAPDPDAVFKIRKNNSIIDTITIEDGETIGTTATATAVAVNDVLSIDCTSTGGLNGGVTVVLTTQRD